MTTFRSLLLLYFLAVGTNAQPVSIPIDDLVCFAPKCGKECLGIDPAGVFLPDVIPADLGDGQVNMLTCQAFIDTKTLFSDYTSRCVETIGDSNATAAGGAVQLYATNQDCDNAEAVDRDLKAIGCCTKADAPLTLPPVTAAPTPAPIIAPAPVAPTDPSLPALPTTPTFSPVVAPVTASPADASATTPPSSEPTPSAATSTSTAMGVFATLLCALV